MDREFLVRMSSMEIYNEEINDLLVPEHRKLQIHESIEVNISSFNIKLVANIIFKWYDCSFTVICCYSCLKRGIYVAGLREEIVTCPEQVLDFMSFGECKFCLLLASSTYYV